MPHPNNEVERVANLLWEFALSKAATYFDMTDNGDGRDAALLAGESVGEIEDELYELINFYEKDAVREWEDDWKRFVHTAYDELPNRVNITEDAFETALREAHRRISRSMTIENKIDNELKRIARHMMSNALLEE